MSHLRIDPPVAIEWPYLAEHITAPRRSWMDAGKVRQYAPPEVSPYKPVPDLDPEPLPQAPAPKPRRSRTQRAIKRNKDTGLYGVTLAARGRYRVIFAVGMVTHKVGLYDTPEDAAWAHDAYCRTRGIDRPLNEEHEESEGCA